ncbi:hypothetical protein CHS0354_022860, partial [Potamilus streckersoni]
MESSKIMKTYYPGSPSDLTNKSSVDVAANNAVAIAVQQLVLFMLSEQDEQSQESST